MKESEKKRVSIVIPCRNEEEYIGKCLDSMVNQSYGIENIEILVCDGCSTDKTGEIIKRYSKEYDQIRHLINDKKVAPTALNLGIKNSTSKIVIIFGSHAYMDKDYVKHSVEKIEETGAACVGGKIINISENEKAEAISLAMSSPFGVGNALFRYSDKETFVDTVAFGAYDKRIFKKVGYFDEELVRNQDDEFNFRVTQSGEKIFLTPKIISHYYTRGSFMKLFKQYFQYGFWKVRVVQKHGKLPALRHIVPMLFVLSLICGIILSPFTKIIRYAFLGEILLYILGAFTFAIKVSKNRLKRIPRIMVSFLILHISYGFGFLDGIVSFHILKSKKSLERNTKSSR